MSRRTYIVIAFVLAVVATITGWCHMMIYKVTPPVVVALWFPLVVITRAVPLAFVQFSLFAAAFAVGIRHWTVFRVTVILVLAYALLAGIAVAIVGST